jgi:hypothetical protein
MRTVSKTLVSLSICLGLSGAVYAQSTPEAKPAPASSAVAKSKTPSVVKTPKEKPAAVSDASKTPMKHERANHVAKPETAAKSNMLDKSETPAAKKVEPTKVDNHELKAEGKKIEHKKSVSKPQEQSAVSKPAATPSSASVEGSKPAK